MNLFEHDRENILFSIWQKKNLQRMEFSRCMPLTRVSTVREFHTPLIYVFAAEKNHAFHIFSLEIKILTIEKNQFIFFQVGECTTRKTKIIFPSTVEFFVGWLQVLVGFQLLSNMAVEH